MPIVLKSGSLNLLEPSGPVQACKGIDLPLPVIVWVLFVVRYVRLNVYRSPDRWKDILNSSCSEHYILCQIPLRLRMKLAFFRHVTTCSFVQRCEGFGETCYLRIQGRQLSGSGGDRIQKGRTRFGSEAKSEPTLWM